MDYLNFSTLTRKNSITKPVKTFNENNENEALTSFFLRYSTKKLSFEEISSNKELIFLSCSAFFCFLLLSPYVVATIITDLSASNDTIVLKVVNKFPFSFQKKIQLNYFFNLFDRKLRSLNLVNLSPPTHYWEGSLYNFEIKLKLSEFFNLLAKKSLIHLLKTSNNMQLKSLKFNDFRLLPLRLEKEMRIPNKYIHQIIESKSTKKNCFIKKVLVFVVLLLFLLKFGHYFQISLVKDFSISNARKTSNLEPSLSFLNYYEPIFTMDLNRDFFTLLTQRVENVNVTDPDTKFTKFIKETICTPFIMPIISHCIFNISYLLKAAFPPPPPPPVVRIITIQY